jgi:xanthine dehydrogenase small subunit
MEELYPSEPIVQALLSAEREGVAIDVARRRFFAPASLDDALRVKSEYPDAIIVQGGTDIGVIANKRGITPPVLLNLAHLPELGSIERNGDAFVIGANATLMQLQHAAKEVIPELHAMLEIFGSPQIRNAGTVAGNIANGSPIGDLLPFFFVAGATIELASVRGRRAIDINSFYKGYKTLAAEKDELITSITLPIPQPAETVKLYKVSKRHDLDISAFTAALRMRISDARLSDVRVAFGGVAATVIRMPQLEAMLEGAEISEELFRRAGETASGAIKPLTDVRGSAEFRHQLAGNVMMKFYWDVVER